jgi:alginate O-acetyltransferase complex protein AlgJ
MEASHAITAAAEALPSRVGGPTDPSHDQQLRRGIIATEVSRPVALGLCALFLLLIYGIPLSQALLEKLHGDDSSLLPLFQRRPNRDNLRQFEKELEQASLAKDFVQPRVQLLLSRLGGVGNKRAVIGRAGFLFYTPGLQHLAGPSFLDGDFQRRRRLEAEADDSTEVHADPRPAILAFHAMLSRRGIKLVLFPVPDKTMLQPMQLHGRRAAGGSLPVAQNVGWHVLAAELRAHGVLVFDPTPRSLALADEPHFLAQDTHWTPRFMERVAHELAGFVTTTSSLPRPAMPPALHAVAQHAERVGDLVDMLKLTDDQALFRPQAVTIHQIQDASGEPWQPDEASDVLLLGDSFTNVFSMDTMGWGESAGLAPQLAFALGRGVDVIAQNDSGAFATRVALSRELSAGEDRLAGKRVVIWEFASRELSVGDWKPVDWTLPPPATGAAP